MPTFKITYFHTYPLQHHMFHNLEINKTAMFKQEGYLHSFLMLIRYVYLYLHAWKLLYAGSTYYIVVGNYWNKLTWDYLFFNSSPDFCTPCSPLILQRQFSPRIDSNVLVEKIVTSVNVLCPVAYFGIVIQEDGSHIVVMHYNG